MLKAHEAHAVVTKAEVRTIERGAKTDFEIAAVDLGEKIEALKTASDESSKKLSSELRRIREN